MALGPGRSQSGSPCIGLSHSFDLTLFRREHTVRSILLNSYFTYPIGAGVIQG